MSIISIDLHNQEVAMFNRRQAHEELLITYEQLEYRIRSFRESNSLVTISGYDQISKTIKNQIIEAVYGENIEDLQKAWNLPRQPRIEDYMMVEELLVCRRLVRMVLKQLKWCKEKEDLTLIVADIIDLVGTLGVNISSTQSEPAPHISTMPMF
ncbi:MAG: hypothetical protein F6K50_06365 [Moorea sp. SIO3I7]|nr:hypothetical protein [Moorena sp. SIO3I7]